MIWDIHVGVDRHDERLIHVRARWTALGSIQDVSLDCGRGLHSVSVEDPYRHEMSVFSRPIEGVFRSDDGVQEPQVFLTWNDGGEPGELAIPLVDRSQHRPQHRPGGLRNTFHRRSSVSASPAPTEPEPDVREAIA
jgi:hypothetical protein